MRKNEFNTLLVVFLVVCVTASWAAYKADRAEDENKALKQENVALKVEVAQWQEAGWVAVNARSWYELDVPGLKPEHLERALNPCYTTSAGNVSSERGCSSEIKAGVVTARGVPIKIVPADR